MAKRRLSILAALLLFPIGIWVGRELPLSSASTTTESPNATRQVPERKNSESPNPDPGDAPSPASMATFVLPPVGTSPAEALALLLPEARRGNPRAACRAALERAACDAAESLQGALTAQLQAEEQRAVHDSIDDSNELAQAQIALIKHAQRCREVPAGLRSDGVDWLARAAQMGHTESALRYIQGQSLPYVEGLELPDGDRWAVIGHPHFAAWHANAPLMADSLIQRGVPEALFIMTLARSEAHGLFDGRMSDDPVEAVAMAMALSWASRGAGQSARLQELSPQDQTRARARFQQLQRLIKPRSLDRARLQSTARGPIVILVGDSAENACAS